MSDVVGLTHIKIKQNTKWILIFSNMSLSCPFLKLKVLQNLNEGEKKPVSYYHTQLFLMNKLYSYF